MTGLTAHRREVPLGVATWMPETGHVTPETGRVVGRLCFFEGGKAMGVGTLAPTLGLGRVTAGAGLDPHIKGNTSIYAPEWR